MAKVTLALVVMAVLVTVMVQTQVSQVQAQSCSSQLSNLNVCAPFVVPGTTATPNSGCCGALQSIDRDCLCSTLRIASRLPSECHLPALSCDA